uniref:Uncharacterized protein n=1 Tax=Vespula pensylvanica TaxID=30213 RepID=A0A834K4P5_VESPE|nr:hypothetical protein H0235_015770 [Vespula pensylvanica]
MPLQWLGHEAKKRLYAEEASTNRGSKGRPVDLHLQQPSRGEIRVGITCDLSRSKNFASAIGADISVRF